MNITLLLMIIFLICIITMQTINNGINNIEKFDSIAYNNIPKMSKEQDINMKKILKITHDLLTENNIKYSMCGGTLLGAIRHQDRIPWDDDADLFIFDYDENKFINLDWEKYDCKIIKHWIGYKICFIKGTKAIENNTQQFWNYPFVDIFIFGKRGNIYTHTSSQCRELWKDDYLYEHEIFPMTLYKFGDLKLFGVNKAYDYLTRYFKEGWETQANIRFSHIHGGHTQKLDFIIADYLQHNKLKNLNYMWIYCNKNIEKHKITHYFESNHIIVFVNDSNINIYLPGLQQKNINNVKYLLLKIYGGKFYTLDNFYKTKI